MADCAQRGHDSPVKNAVPYRIESVDNALRLIRLLQEREELGITAAAKLLGVAPSTAHRLMTMLVYHGFAAQNARRAYTAGVARLSGTSVEKRPQDLKALVRPHLVDVSRTLQETTHLVVLDGTAARYLDGVEHPQHLRFASRAGMTMPAHCTAAGKAILAQLSGADLEALYPHGLPLVYGPAPTQLSGLKRQLMGVRRSGFAVNGEESERGILGVAVCLRDSAGAVHGAIAAGMPISRCPNSRIPLVAHELQRAASNIARALDVERAHHETEPSESSPATA